MASSSVLLTVLTVYLLQGAACLQWSSGPKDNDFLYVCGNDSILLPWNVSKAARERILDIQWYYEGRSQELISSEVHDNFFTTPAFSGRVEPLSTNAGIVLYSATPLDTGNYSVVIEVQTGNGVVSTLRTTVTVIVSDTLIAGNGVLHVEQEAVAMEDSSHQFHVVLSCGNFIHHQHPPFDVVWTSPSEKTVSSTSYKDGQFLLMLDNPVQGGTYTCQVPARSVCLHGDPVRASHAVDGVSGRLAIIEARQQALEHENMILKEKENSTADLLQDIINTKVVFHARRRSDVTVSSGSTLVLDNVVTNQGNGYSPSTGVFTAPVSGFYFFMATTQPNNDQYFVYLELEVNGRETDYTDLYTDHYKQAGSVHAAVQLNKGDRVWLRTTTVSHVFARSTAFSGFLIKMTI